MTRFEQSEKRERGEKREKERAESEKRERGVGNAEASVA